MEVCRFFQLAGGGTPACDDGGGAGSNGQTCRSQLGTDLLGWLDSAVLVTHVYRGLSMLCSIQIIAAAAAAANMATAVRSIQYKTPI